jgi:hypothetical protein
MNRRQTCERNKTKGWALFAWFCRDLEEHTKRQFAAASYEVHSIATLSQLAGAKDRRMSSLSLTYASAYDSRLARLSIRAI